MHHPSWKSGIVNKAGDVYADMLLHHPLSGSDKYCEKGGQQWHEVVV
jgi:hypothetical protein